MIYDVCYGAEVIGKIKIYQDGLYYQVTCRIKAPDDNIYRLLAVGEIIKVDLGICLLSEGNLIINRKIPAKKFTSPILRVNLVADKLCDNREFIPIFQENEFKHITKLLDAKWHIQNGITGVIIMR